MKRNRETLISLIALALLVVGLVLAFFCVEAWQRVLGLVIVTIDVILAIDFMSDNI